MSGAGQMSKSQTNYEINGAYLYEAENLRTVYINDVFRVISKMDNLDAAVRIFGEMDDIEDGAAFIARLEQASDDTIDTITSVLAKSADDVLETTITNINRFDNLDDVAIIANRFGTPEEGARFLSFINEREITAIRGSAIEDAVHRVPFYRAYKRFRGGEIPGMETVRVNSSVKVDVPENLTVINARYAGDIHPTGVPFNEQGFPVFDTDFTVKIDDMFYQSSDEVQFMIGNDLLYEATQSNPNITNSLGLDDLDLDDLSKGFTPDNFTWHHNQNTGILELVNRRIHSSTGHTGGRAIWGGGSEFR